MATEVRKEVIDLDNLTTSKAVDALLNFETVTLFHNQRLEVGQFYNCIKVTCTPNPALLSAADLCVAALKWLVGKLTLRSLISNPVCSAGVPRSDWQDGAVVSFAECRASHHFGLGHVICHVCSGAGGQVRPVSAISYD